MDSDPKKGKHIHIRHWDLATAILVSLAIIIYGSYSYYQLHKKDEANLKTISELQTTIQSRESQLASAKTENEGLKTNLISEQTRNNEFQNQINQITSNVGTLVKLSKTDKELLQKYSKVYFLSENYIPSNLTDIDPKYLSDPKKVAQFHSNAYTFLRSLLDAAASNNLGLQVLSGYRSFGTQAGLKQSYKFTYGAGANSFSADQGYSEHQLGTAVDFTVPSIGSTLSGFDKNPAFAWLNANAYRYGFILSYPNQNTYYEFEPWHWRFVGVALATKIHNDNTLFYYLDQRDIDQYLVNIFD